MPGSVRFRDVASLIGSFAITFALLSAVWMVSSGRPPDARPTDPPTSASQAHTLVPASAQLTATLAPTLMPTPTETPTETPPETPVPLPTSALARRPQSTSSGSEPTPLFAPTQAPAQTQTIAVAAGAYVASEVPDGGSIRASGDGIVLETTAGSPDALSVRYTLDPAALPVGAVIQKVDTRVCGRGEGQFWQIHGPAGSTPGEYDTTQPDADGCWHFVNATTEDLSVVVSTKLDSRLYIQSVEYTLTVGR